MSCFPAPPCSAQRSSPANNHLDNISSSIHDDIVVVLAAGPTAASRISPSQLPGSPPTRPTTAAVASRGNFLVSVPRRQWRLNERRGGNPGCGMRACRCGLNGAHVGGRDGGGGDCGGDGGTGAMAR
ncbi:unnamed protein product [Lampetra planeri]